MKSILHYIVLLSEIMHKKPIIKHFVYFTLTLGVLILYGYYFGTFDQASHIPFLKKNADPLLFPNDRFFDLRNEHFSYFWLFFIPLYKLHILEISMFFIYFITTYLTFWSIWNLAITLFKKPLSSLLCLLALSFPHFGFSAFPLFEFSLLNRTFTLPFELIALNWFLQKKYIRSFFLLGLLYNLHVISVNFFLAMMLFDMFMRVGQNGIKRIFISLAVFLMGAFPVLLWKIKSGQTSSFTPQWKWFKLLDNAFFNHLFHFFTFSNPYTLPLTLGGIASLYLLLNISKKYKNDLHLSIFHFTVAGIGVLLIQAAATNIYPISLIIQFQIMRVGVVLMLFSYLYLSDFVAQLIVEDKNHHISFVWLIALTLSFTPLLFLIIYLMRRFIRSSTQALSLALFMVFIFIAALIVSYRLDLWKPGIHIFPAHTSFYEVQEWAKNNTPTNTVFITPPYKWSFYETEWRVGSQRSTVSTFSELLEAAFDPTYVSYWKKRFNDVAPGSISQFKGDYLKNLIIIKNAYNSLSRNDLIRVGNTYRASYVVIEKPHALTFPVIYENKDFYVYKLPNN